MRIAHLADLHLGFGWSQGPQDEFGHSMRMRDVSAACTAVFAGVRAARPDLIVIAGDVFHSSRPENVAVHHLMLALARVRAELPDTPIVIVAGNHEYPTSYPAACVLQLLEPLGVHVVWRTSEQLAFPALGLSVLCVPEAKGMARPALLPNPEARWNVLLLHGEIRGVIPGTRESDDSWSAEDVSGAWDYVALGHYHVHHQVAPRAWYAGAVEYTTTNVWGELRDEARKGVPGKGWVLHDCTTGEHTFHPIATRRFIELPWFSADGLTAPEVDARIQATVDAAPGGIDGAVVRLIVEGVTREVNASLDRKAMRKIRARTFYFAFEAIAPAPAVEVREQRAAMKRMTLAELVADKLVTNCRESGLDPVKLLALSAEYMGMAEEKGLLPGDEAQVAREADVAA